MSSSTIHRNIIASLFAALTLFASLTLVLLLLPFDTQSFSIAYQTTNNPKPAQKFGIGFDLTTSYGTVAVSYPNGSIFSIARIEGDAAYHEMMYRLSFESSRTSHQPYTQIGDNLVDWPRHLWREFRKNLGQPASEDVRTLSRLLSALLKEAITFTGQNITWATISIPFLPGFYAEDGVDAFEYLSLQTIEFYNFLKYYPLYSISSVYLMNGRLLVPCIGNKYRDRCPIPTYPIFIADSEFDAMTISYTRSSLAAGEAFFSNCYSGYYYGEMSIGDTDTTLGYDARGDGEYGEGPYWAKVKYMLRKAIRKFGAARIIKIVIWGDASSDLKFLEIVRELVDEELACKTAEVIFHDPVFSGAKGSAEFARRALSKGGKQGNMSQVLEDL